MAGINNDQLLLESMIGAPVSRSSRVPPETENDISGYGLFWKHGEMSNHNKLMLSGMF